MKKYKKGFTLAEILVTLGVIGIIAAMTVPTLVQDVQDAQYKTAWKKNFAELNQATMRVLQENGGSIKGTFSSWDKLRDGYLNYMNYAKKCDYLQTSGNCWHFANNWKALDGSNKGNMTFGSAILNSGSLIYFYPQSTSCNSLSYGSTGIYVCAQILVDINGFKAPNVVGKDIFYSWLQENSLKPAGTEGDGWGHTCSAFSSGEACAAKYLYQ